MSRAQAVSSSEGSVPDFFDDDVRVSQSQAGSAPEGSVPDFFDAPFGNEPSAPAQSADVETEDAFVLPPPADQGFVPPAPDQLDTDNQLRGPIEFDQRASQAGIASSAGIFVLSSG